MLPHEKQQNAWWPSEHCNVEFTTRAARPRALGARPFSLAASLAAARQAVYFAAQQGECRNRCWPASSETHVKQAVLQQGAGPVGNEGVSLHFTKTHSSVPLSAFHRLVRQGVDRSRRSDLRLVCHLPDVQPTHSHHLTPASSQGAVQQFNPPLQHSHHNHHNPPLQHSHHTLLARRSVKPRSSGASTLDLGLTMWRKRW